MKKILIIGGRYVATCCADPTYEKTVLNWQAKRELLEMCKSSWKWQSKNPNGYK